jgi:hypothetical protein
MLNSCRAVWLRADILRRRLIVIGGRCWIGGGALRQQQD